MATGSQIQDTMKTDLIHKTKYLNESSILNSSRKYGHTFKQANSKFKEDARSS